MIHPIRILLVEDEELVREAIVALLSMEDGLEVIGEAGSAAMALQLATELKPDVMLLDLQLPDRWGAAIIEEVLHCQPQIKVLVLSAHVTERELSLIFKAGAVGIILKIQAITELVKAIREIQFGRSTLHPNLARMLLLEHARDPQRWEAEKALNQHEINVLVCIAQGLTNREIGAKLGISHYTAQGYVSRILTKLGLNNRTQAALFALKRGIAKLEGSDAIISHR